MQHDVDPEALAAGRGYESLFVPALFAPWAPRLVEVAQVARGQHVLDVACGTGILARHARRAVGEAGRVVGLDPAPGMIAVAREADETVEWVPGSAEELPFGDGAFDAVLSQFGLMFFTDRMAALREMFRVLRPGGRACIAVWNGLDANEAYSEVIGILDREVGRNAGDALRLPFSMGDSSLLRGLLEAAAFTEVEVETRTGRARFPSTRVMVEAELRGWLPLFGIHLDEETVAAVLDTAERALSRHVGPAGEAEFGTSAHVATGRRA